ncbi:MAG TPA: copper resistance CopC family protein [Dongiaceae bacterium]|nr:copper resistance CopC family protein [Dongiaceae bacterium]
MRKYIRNLASAMIALALCEMAAVPAMAHAVIVSAAPTADEQVKPGKLAIRLEFNSRIDKQRSRLQLTAPDGAKSEVVIDQGGEPNILTATTRDLAIGDYVLRWQVLAIDGHITRGDIPFKVAA